METLKDYLVKITAQTEGIADATAKLKNLTMTIAKAMIGAKSIMTIVMGAAKAVNKNVKEAIKLNDTLEETAKKLKKTTEQARAHQIALSVMGKTMDEIKKSKSLKATYDEMMKLGQAFEFKEAPKGTIRLKDINAELNKLKFVAKMGFSQFYEAFRTYCAKPLGQLRGWLKDFAEKLNSSLGEFARKMGLVVAKVFKELLYHAQHIVMVAGQLWEWATRLGKWMMSAPSWIKTAGVAALGVIAMIQGKLKPLHVLLTAIYLLIDDFVVWSQGGKSFFGNAWQGVIDTFQKLGDFLNNDLGELTALAEALSFLTTGKGVVGNVLSFALKSMRVTAGVVNVNGNTGTTSNGTPNEGKPNGGTAVAKGLGQMVTGIYIGDIWKEAVKAEQLIKRQKEGALTDDDKAFLSAHGIRPVSEVFPEEAAMVAYAGAGRYGAKYGNATPAYANGSGGGGAVNKTANTNVTATINVSTSNAMSAAQQVMSGLSGIIAQNVQGALA